VYNNKILNSTNKMKTTGNIIKSEMGTNDQNIHDGDVSDNLWVIPDSFHNYFLSIAKKITQNNKYNNIIVIAIWCIIFLNHLKNIFLK
jgi:hypothetical protein